MAYDILKKLPSSDDIIAKIPLSASGYLSVEENLREIQSILSGKDHRLLIIVGPCSAWPSDAVLEYAKRLVK